MIICLGRPSKSGLVSTGLKKAGCSGAGRELGSRGWSNAYEAINTVCEINLTQGGSFGHNFCVSIPVYSLISDLKFRPSDSRLQFEFFRAAELENICLLAVWKQTSRHQTPLIRARVSPQVESSETHDGLWHKKGSVPLSEPNEDDEVEIKAIHDEIGEIESWTARVRNITPEPARNALFAAIKRFCPESEMQALLVRPYAQKGRKLKESAAYELHVLLAVEYLRIFPSHFRRVRANRPTKGQKCDVRVST